MIRYFLARGDRGGSAMITERLESVTCSKAFCAACRSTGKIAKAGGARRHYPCGNEVALDGGGGDGNARQVTAEDTEPVPTSLLFSEQVTAGGRGTSEGYPYLIEAPDGQQFAGRLDNSGRLPRIYAGAAGSSGATKRVPKTLEIEGCAEWRKIS